MIPVVVVQTGPRFSVMNDFAADAYWSAATATIWQSHLIKAQLHLPQVINNIFK
jgi:hypothetical protein